MREARRRLRRLPPRQGHGPRRRARPRSSTRCLTNDLGRIGPGQAQYTLCCDDVRRRGRRPHRLPARRRRGVPGPERGQHRRGRRAGCAAAAPAGVEVDRPARELRRARGAGPALRRGARPRSGCRPRTRLHVVRRRRAGRACRSTVCRTGYTGEHGYELRAAVGRHRRRCGTRCSRPAPTSAARPCGLGARDTLRTEMGYPLHGQDLSLDITPVQARSGWAVGWDKPAFWGREALLAERAAGAAPAAVGPASRWTAASRARTCAVLGAGRRRRRRGDQRDVLADAAAGASGWPCWTARWPRATRWRRRARARPSVCAWSSRRSCTRRPALTGGRQSAGFSCTAQLLPSGSSKKTNEFHGTAGPVRPPARRRRGAPGSRRRRGRPAARGPPRRRRRRAAGPSASPAASPSARCPPSPSSPSPAGSAGRPAWCR